jgi:hypothetical protein
VRIAEIESLETGETRDIPRLIASMMDIVRRSPVSSL